MLLSALLEQSIYYVQTEYIYIYSKY